MVFGLLSSFSTGPVGGSPTVKARHPWLGIIHPGPWTQLPPAPPPVRKPRSKSVFWTRPRVPAPNPFEEEVEVQTGFSGRGAAASSGDVEPPDEPVPPERPAKTLGSSNLGQRGAAAQGGRSLFLPRSVSVPAVGSVPGGPHTSGPSGHSPVRPVYSAQAGSNIHQLHSQRSVCFRKRILPCPNPGPSRTSLRDGPRPRDTGSPWSGGRYGAEV